MRSLTLGQLGELFDGPHATPTRTDTGPYFLNIASLVGGRLDLAQSDHVSERDFTAWTRRVVPQAGDLLFSYETRLGDAALMPEGVRACLGRRMALLRPDREVIDPRYLLYYYLSPYFQELVDRNAVHGATVNRIALSTMGSWPVQLPELEGQRAVAKVLGALDDKIAANANTAATCEDLIAAHFVRLGLDDVDSDESVVLTDLIEVNPLVRRPAELEPIYVEMQALPTKGMLISSWSSRPPKAGARFQNGDTLLARITPCLENRKTGFVDFLEEGQVGLGSTEYIVMRSRRGVPAALSYFVAVSERFRTFAIRHMVGTSGRQRVSADVVAEFEVRRPEDSELERFGGVAEPIVSMLSSLRMENHLLSSLRDTLLPQLMSGRLRVKDAEKRVEAVV